MLLSIAGRTSSQSLCLFLSWTSTRHSFIPLDGPCRRRPAGEIIVTGRIRNGDDRNPTDQQSFHCLLFRRRRTGYLFGNQW